MQEAAHYIKGAAANLGLKAIQHYSTELDALAKDLKKNNSKDEESKDEMVIFIAIDNHVLLMLRIRRN